MAIASPHQHSQIDSGPRTVATPTPPVRYWAFFGGLCTAFIAYVLIRWITGPYWHHVSPGVTPVPTYMKVAIRGWEIAGCLAMIFTYWWFLWRPFKRERRLTTDGALVLAFSLLWFQDPLSNYINYWFTYNGYFVNMGSWVNSVPGWMAGGTPGHAFIEPLLWVIPFYIYGWMPWIMFGCWVMRKLEQVRPGIKVHNQILWCWLAMGLVDVFVEGILFIPLGFFQYGGGHLAVFPHAYDKWPLLNIIFIGWISVGLTCIRYYKNDKGETIVERGVTGLQASERKKNALRVLAMIGGTQAVLIVFNIVVGVSYGGHTDRWPADTQARSYFTLGICGAGTHRACPGPGIPNLRGVNTIQVDPNGRLYVPPGARQDIPRQVPLLTHKPQPGAFHGGLF
jgi:Spirocyclase AveC-like